MTITRVASPLPPMGLVKAGLGKAVLKSAFGAALAMVVLGAGQAHALAMTVNGQDWDVTTFYGTYNANISKFATPANGGVMPWFTGDAGVGRRDSSLADVFATAVGSGLGFPNTGLPLVNPTEESGPFFAFSCETTVIESGICDVTTWNAIFWDLEDVAVNGLVTENNLIAWAQATPVPAQATSVPGPIPALGVAAAFGFSRKLRKLIKASKAVGAFATTG